MGCCDCLKIQIISPPASCPPAFLTGGKLFVDLLPDQSLELSKRLSELSEIDSIAVEAALPLSLPYSPINDYLADYIRNFNRIGGTFDPYTVLVQEGAVTHTIFTRLYFTGADDKGRGYECQIKRQDDHWLDLSEKTYLADLDFGTFEFTVANVESNWANNADYQDGDAGVYFPLVHYGAWLQAAAVVLEDLRPWHHLLAVLQKGFCAIGWTFRCPWLETDAGRRLGAYLLGKNYGQELERGFRAHIETALSGGGRVYYDVEDSDPGADYDAATGEFSGSGTIDLMATATFEHYAISGGTAGFYGFIFQIIREDAGGLQTVLAEQVLGLPESGTYTAELSVEEVTILPGQKVYVQLSPDGDTALGPVYAGSFQGNPKRGLYQRGDEMDIAGVIDPDLSLLDFLKGVVHLCNGKLDTRLTDRELWVYTPYDAEWYGEAVDGFYQDTITDATALVVHRSRQVAVLNESYARYVRLKFQDSSDAYIGKMKMEENEPLYSKYVDFGEGLEEEDKRDNPLFQPTVNAELTKFQDLPPLITNYGLDIPFLWDNQDGKLSFDLGKRVCLFEGYVQQWYDEGGADQPRAWKWESNILSSLPYAYQVPNSKLKVTGVVTTLTTRIVYGEDDNDFYTLGYKNELLRRNLASRVSFDLLMSATLYRQTDFRGLYRIYYDGRTSFFRIKEISGRQTCKQTPVQAVFVPEPFIGDLCTDVITVEPDPCSNQPRITTSIDADTGEATATADDTSITSPIDTDTWTYSTDDGDTWSSYTPGTPIAPAVGSTRVMFRRVVTFSDDCPQKTVNRTADAATACSNNPTIVIAYNEGTNTASATGGGDFSSSIDTDTWTVSIDGGTASAYTPGDDITGFMTLTFTRALTFIGACPAVSVSQTLEVEGEPCANEPDLVLTQVADCVYVPTIGGTYDSSICMTVIEVSRDDGANWLPWDRMPVVFEPDTRIRASIQYCDFCPPTYIEKTCPIP